MSSSGAREEEAEFGLQRAETGDRRLAQNNANAPASDLRAAHSSDFFSGQRDRGRDDSAPSAAQSPPSSPQPSPPQRAQFRRPTSPRTTPTTQYTNPPPPPPPKQSNNVSYDPKRKLVRKRPIYASTQAPSTFAQSSPQQQFSEPQQQQQTNFERRIPQQIRQNPTTIATPTNVPPQYREEYVEVSRVTPKQNRLFSNNPSPAPFSQSTPNQNKKDGLAELYNYNAQSTPGINVQTDNKPFKVRNSFSVATDIPEKQDFVRINVNNNNGRSTPTSTDYNTAASRGFSSNTPAYRNFNSVSYEPEKNNFVHNTAKQNYYNSPSTTPTSTSVYTTTRSDPPYNLNTVAYNTNIGFNAKQTNLADNDEDDGQYRPPSGEDDGQYRPELYERERELLSGAHSLNIAASGNRLPEDQKQKGKTQKPHKPSQLSQTGAPRPFRPAPAPSTTAPAPPSTFEPVQTTTYRPQTVNTQRTFDYFQTYTTTSRPSDPPVQYQPSTNNYENTPIRPTATSAPRSAETRPPPRATSPPPTVAPVPPAQRPTTRAPQFAKPAKKNEDTSYDYAYYDSDPGFSEYDHIEEFGKTKSKA